MCRDVEEVASRDTFSGRSERIEQLVKTWAESAQYSLVVMNIIHQPGVIVVTSISAPTSSSPIALTAVTLMVYEVLGDSCVIVNAVTSGPLVIRGKPLPLHLTVYLSRGTPPV